MSGTPMRFDRLAGKRKMVRNGAGSAEPLGPVYQAGSPMLRAANERLEAFLRYSPRGERDVEALLNTPARRKREKWLRGVLDACED